MKSLRSSLRHFINFLVRHEWIVLVLFAVFLLRLPTLFEPNWYGDEEIYLVMGQGLRKGLIFYRDIFDHKPPLIYVFAAIAQTVFWFRLMLMVVHALSVVYFAKLSELLFTKKTTMIFATSVYAFYSTIPLLEGTIANGENFMTVPALIGMYMLYRMTTKKTASSLFSWFAIGFLFSLAFLIKVPIGFDFLAGGIFWWWFSERNLSLWSSVKKLFSWPLMLMLLGFFIPVLLSVFYYSYVGAFEPYVRSVLMQNIGYIKSWTEGGQQTSMLSNPLVWRLLLIGGFLLVLGRLKKYTTFSLQMLFLSIWLLFSVYGALLSNRPYPHYLLQPLIPAVFLAFLLLEEIFSTRKKDAFVGFLSIFIGGIMVFQIGFSHYPTVSYYKNFILYALGRIDRGTYEGFYPAALKRNQQIAAYLRSRTQPTERVFVWGEEPAIYDMADRLPVGKYMVSFHIRDFPNGFADTYNALLQYKPNYIVVIPQQVPPFPEIETMLATDYLQVHQIENVLIYRRVLPKLIGNTL